MKLIFVFLFLASAYTSAQTNPDLPSPSVLTKKYLELISKRKVGQTAFAVKTDEGQMQQSESSDREIQESDVFKLGRKGNKELFLLNNYRGFQVISFQDGLESPRLIARLPVYNNWSSEMYYLEKQDQVLIMNSEWEPSLNSWGSHNYTVIYLIDVKDSSSPKILRELKVPGYLDSSRLVGDVLYTISSSWGSQQKAQLSSVKIGSDSLNLIESQALHSEKRWVRTMNVVKNGEKYFVISSETSWQERGDHVSVFDITSSKGDISKLFTAHARGQVSERSDTFIHKNHLFVLSNWRKDDNTPSRISVESFPMKASSAVITSTEGMRLSVGDTNGLHASLQDTRVSGDYLYAFWVPANNIDPFDLFDISDPKKLTHIGQLQFDGWISKAIPVDLNGRKFVIGLGWIVPTTSENGKRYPQAMIFEIKKNGDRVRHEVVANLTLNSDDLWASLNDEDKTFEVVEEVPGIFNILFPVTFRTGWKSGAKVVTADLNKLVLSEGASIIADQNWLRRVFLNREVRGLHAFSDEQLETYRQDDMAGRGIARVVSILELARNVIDFHQINENVGTQIIRNENNIEVRMVPMTDTDAEKTEVVTSSVIKGRHHWHKIDGNKIYAITAFYKKENRTSGQYTWEAEVFDHAMFNTMDLTTGVVSSERMEVTTRTDEQDYWYFNVEATSSTDTDLLQVGQNIFRLKDGVLLKMSVPASCEYFFDGEEGNMNLRAVGKDFYAFNTFTVQPSDDEEGYSYDLPFMKKLNVSGDQLECSPSVNVPGQPVMTDREFLVTREYQNYWYAICYEYYPGEGDFWGGEGKTISLRFKTPTQVELVDILNKEITSGLLKKRFITYSSKEKRVDIWSLSEEGEFTSRPEYLSGYSRNSFLISAQSLGGKDYVFMKNNKLVDVYAVSKTGKMTQIPVTTKYDLDRNDGSGEFVFAIESIDRNTQSGNFILSGGNYGVAELKLQ